MLQLKIRKILSVLLVMPIMTTCLKIEAQGIDLKKENLHQRFDSESGQLSFQRFSGSEQMSESEFQSKLRNVFQLPESEDFVLQKKSQDQLGMSHSRMQQTHSGVPILDAIIVVHSKNGLVSAVNGKTVPSIATQKMKLSESSAFQKALSIVGAQRYQWEVPGANDFLRRITGITASTWYPVGELLYVKANQGKYEGQYRLCWKFDIYAVEPLLRRDIYIDAETGELDFANDRLCTVDAQGTAHTRFSGVQTITTDSTGPFFRLRESGRAQGVETYNMLNGTNYSLAVDFIDSNNIWDVFVPAFDNSATDAHWGAEMTYDYFNTFFGRNSYDDQGSKLISYIHYDNSYSNAFWNGIFMTYGDGGGNNNPFCGLDVCGHEFSHGVTEYTAGLIYSYESGALNESFSDIFGNSIEFWARPGNASWLIGDDIGAFRSMSSPSIFLNPDTYLGSNWATGGWDNGGVHTNSGVQNYWYYLLTAGGSGTNDNGDSYSVSGIGLVDAGAIAYRNLSVYLTPSDGYAEARYYAIQAAIDLFGECSPQMISTMNAWYAVGVGNPYTGSLEARFYTADTTLCRVPNDVAFENRSFSALNYLWDFGDGGTSTDEHPTHTYTTYGDFDVTLYAYGCNGGVDTLVSVSRVRASESLPCNVNMPSGSGSLVETACEGSLYDSGGGNDYLPSTISTVSIQPGNGSQVMLSFSAFNYAAGDRITIFDGPDANSPILGVFAGTTIPPNQVSTSGALTVRESTNGANQRAGFAATWSCLNAISEVGTSNTLKITPNPNNGNFDLNWENSGLQPWNMKIFASNGNLVFEQSGKEDAHLHQKMNLAHLSKGLYFIELSLGEDRATQRIIVQ